jgi:hypothetical protein
MTDYSDQERKTLRTAAFGAMYLVSSAEPGFMDMVKETVAGSKAFATSSPELRDLFKGGGMPQMPKGSRGDIEASVLSALGESRMILESKGGGELEAFTDAVSNAVDQVAQAAGGTSPSEVEAVNKVKAALAAGV